MAQQRQDSIPVWEKRVTRGRRSGKETTAMESYNSHCEAVSVKWNNPNFHQTMKELKCQGETFDCFDS